MKVISFSISERLNENDTDKIRFFLSKADTAGTESDRQRVLMQITQELCKRPGLNKCGFDMPTIYIPSLTDRVCLALYTSVHFCLAKKTRKAGNHQSFIENWDYRCTIL